MGKIILGIDPDSKAHGVAVYAECELISLQSIPLVGINASIINTYAPMMAGGIIVEVHIEDVCANNAVFRAGGNAKVNMSIARRLGMVQQSQSELERVFDYYSIKVVKHKISKMWKKDKAQFEKVTGWTGRSNEDTRSASWFGYQGLMMSKK